MSEELYTNIHGIKLYKGYNSYEKRFYKKNVKYLQSLIKTKIFSDITPSMVTSVGYFTNIHFNEETDFHKFLPPCDYIDKVVCNFGKLLRDGYKEAVVKSTSKRGRKKKIKEKKNKRAKGNASCFNSQVTHEIRHSKTNNKYKIKLCRNGSCQIPGGKKTDMTDLIDPLLTLQNYLRYCFNDIQYDSLVNDNLTNDSLVINNNLVSNDKLMRHNISIILNKYYTKNISSIISTYVDNTIDIDYIKGVTRNYKNCLINPKYKIRLKELDKCIEIEKQKTSYNRLIDIWLNEYSDQCKDDLKKLLSRNNMMQIAETAYNDSRSVSLTIKLHRPQPNKIDKKVMAKITDKGKFNYEGGNMELEVQEIYYWLHHLIGNKYKDIVLFDTDNFVDDYEPNECSDESIYDSDLKSYGHTKDAIDNLLLDRDIKKERLAKINKKC